MNFFKALILYLGLGIGLLPSIGTAQNLLYVEVIDDATSPRAEISSPKDIKNKPFRLFVEGVSAAFGLDNVSFGKPYAPDHTPDRTPDRTVTFSKITFARVPLVSSGEATIMAAPPQGDAICSSPMGVVSKIDGQLHASLVWNERLALRDEAVALGHLSETNQALRSFTQNEFTAFAQCYASRHFGGSSGPCVAESEIPPELQMLFKAAPQSGLLPFQSTVLTYFNTTLPARVGAYIERANEFVTDCTK